MKLFFSVICVCIFLICTHANSFAEKSFVINEIEIQNNNIFDLKKEKLPFFPYGIVNKLHATTRAGVIRRELLFKKGLPVTHELIEESERKLREFSFIRVAEITVRDKKAVVYTQDSWTTEPQFSYGGGGGETKYSMGVEEKNFLGYGKHLGLFYSRDEEDKISRQIFYNDPQFLGGRWRMGMDYSKRSDGYINNYSFGMPYYRIDTPWSVNVEMQKDSMEENIYRHNDTVATLNRDKKDFEATGGFRFAGNATTAHRIGLGYEYKSMEYYDLQSSVISELPADYSLKCPLVTYQNLNYDYIKVRNVNTFARDEDYNLGSNLKLKYGYSPKSMRNGGVEKQFKIAHSIGRKFDHEDFIITENLLKSMYINNESRNFIAQSITSYYNRFQARQLLACNLQGAYGRNLDVDEEFILGGMNGLRGCSAREFSGSKMALVNIEDRFLIAEEFISLAGLGAVIFYDAGYAWGEHDVARISDIKSDIGVGLRLGLTRSSEGYVLRFDYAYSLQKTENEHRFVVSFGSRQNFADERTTKKAAE